MKKQINEEVQRLQEIAGIKVEETADNLDAMGLERTETWQTVISMLTGRSVSPDEVEAAFANSEEANKIIAAYKSDPESWEQFKYR